MAADFATSTVVGSPPGVIAAMWNHGARMGGQAQKQETSLPVLTGQELADITRTANRANATIYTIAHGAASGFEVCASRAARSR